MKSAFELAMERLNKDSPTVKLTEEQKKQMAELDSKYAAKIAEREIFLKAEVAKAVEKGDFEAMEQLQKQLVSTRKSLQVELEAVGIDEGADEAPLMEKMHGLRRSVEKVAMAFGQPIRGQEFDEGQHGV